MPSTQRVHNGQKLDRTQFNPNAQVAASCQQVFGNDPMSDTFSSASASASASAHQRDDYAQGLARCSSYSDANLDAPNCRLAGSNFMGEAAKELHKLSREARLYARQTRVDSEHSAADAMFAQSVKIKEAADKSRTAGRVIGGCTIVSGGLAACAGTASLSASSGSTAVAVASGVKALGNIGEHAGRIGGAIMRKDAADLTADATTLRGVQTAYDYATESNKEHEDVCFQAVRETEKIFQKMVDAENKTNRNLIKFS